MSPSEMTDEIDRLRSVIAGRTTAPTDAEIDAHGGRGGRWRAAWTHLRGGYDWLGADEARGLRDGSPPGSRRWWPLARDGTPTSWPTLSGDEALGNHDP